jgi:3-phenylpropionate/trans-cinnamate dioxygenase ferredoxin subunit
MKYVVAAVSEIPPGARKIVEVGRRSIGIFNVGGEFFALRNRCPHQGARLCEGTVWGALDAPVPGEYRYDPAPEMVSCPWHGWEFHIRTGQSWCDPERVRTAEFCVSVAAGADLVECDEQTGQYRIKGPYQAETFPVAVEDDYLVVELR